MSGYYVEEGTYQDGDPYDQDEYTRLVHDLLRRDHVVKFASERIQTLISEENSLRHNRMTWFASIEGFLWLSFAAVISDHVGWDNGFWLMVVIPIIGILICLSAISAIRDADEAVKLLLKKWRTIQNRNSKNPYVAIPVVGASYAELEQEREYSIPRWHFALFVLVGWSFGLVGVVVTKIGLCLSFPWWYFVLTMPVCWIASLAGVVVLVIITSSGPTGVEDLVGSMVGSRKKQDYELISV